MNKEDTQGDVGGHLSASDAEFEKHLEAVQRAKRRLDASHHRLSKFSVVDFEKIPQAAWYLRSAYWQWNVKRNALSFWSGIVGLLIALVLLGIGTVLLMEFVEQIFPQVPSPLTFSFVMQSIFIPPMLTFSFVAAVLMFWHGSILKRFATALLIVSPGWIAFGVTGTIVFGHSFGNDFWEEATVMMFAYFLGSGIISLIVQLWTPWALTNYRDNDDAIQPTGIRSIIELTVVAAIGFTVFRAALTEDMWIGIAILFGLGFTLSGYCISVFYARMGGIAPDRHGYLAIAAPFAVSLVAATLFNVNTLYFRFGWIAWGWQIGTLVVAAIYGAILLSATGLLCTWWLKGCGWRLVHRKRLSMSVCDSAGV